ncbi:MAG: hypothetical protein KGI27_08520 [Thaumarchaeota archaeon]|nr:hypothetical protein [Nitrososphaerota archaeon]
MEDPIINLAAINAITEPYSAIILETIAKKKRVTFKDLSSITELPNESLSKQLEKLQKFSMIRGELTDPEGGSYSFYYLTKLGEEFRIILHEMLQKTIDVKPDQISDKFVIDSESFKKISEQKTINEIKQIFSRCKIIFTNHDFSTSMELAVANKNESLESFLNDENLIEISETYHDEVTRTRTEYYLRRIKRLLPNKARLIATAKDLKASIITDDDKIASAARGLGIMCAKSNPILELQKGEILRDKFFELSVRDPSIDIDLPIRNNPLATLKKN